MGLNERIKTALLQFGDPVVPGLSTGEETRYYTFNYDLIPCQFAGNRPVYYKALVQVHLFAPLTFNYIRRTAETAQALAGAGFTWPDVVDASEKDARHFVFECEAITKNEEGE